MQLVDDTQILILDQACVQYTLGDGVALVGGASCVTDQITDHFAPHCYELGNAAINKIRVLAAC